MPDRGHYRSLREWEEAENKKALESFQQADKMCEADCEHKPRMWSRKVSQHLAHSLLQYTHHLSQGVILGKWKA